MRTAYFSAKLTPLGCVSLLLLASLILFYWPFLTGNGTFYLFDFMYGWEPYLSYIVSRLHAGQFPLWNPYSNCGTPENALMAPSALYAGNWLFALLPFSAGMAVNIVVNQVCAGLGMFLFIRRLGMNTWSAVAGGLIYPLTGLEFSLQNTYSLQAILAWLPLSLWSMQSMAGTTRGAHQAGWFALSCLFVWLLVSAGMPEMSAVCLVGIFVLCAVMCCRSTAPQRFRAMSLQSLSLVLGTLFCSAQVLPLLEWAKLSPRAAGLSLDEVMRWSANWYDIAGLFLAQPLGDIFDVSNAFHQLVLKEPQPYIASAFVGPTVITAAAWGIADKRFKWGWVLIALALLCITLAMGSNSSLALDLAQVSGARSFRYPIKLLAFAVLIICFCAARGIGREDDDNGTAANRLVALLWCALMLSGLLLCLVAHGTFGNSQAVSDFLAALFLPNKSDQLIRNAAMLIGVAAATSACIGLSTCLLWHLRSAGKLPSERFHLFTLVLAVIPLIACALQFHHHVGPADFYTRRLWIAESLKKLTSTAEQPLRVCTLYYSINAPRNVVDPNDITASDYEYNRQMLVPASPMDAAIGSTLYFILGETLEHYLIKSFAAQQHNASNDIPLAAYCQSTSTRYVLTTARVVSEQALLTAPVAELNARFFTKQVENRDWNLRIYRVNDCLPHAYFARNIKWGSPHQAVVDYVRYSDQSQFNPHALTILEHGVSGEKAVPIIVTPADLAASTVRFTIEEPEHLQISAFTPTANYLVLTDEFYPGWKALLDGKPVPIFRANAFLRAVFVPQGKHTIDFLYEPRTWKIGLAGSLAALFAALAITAWLHWRRD